MAKKIKQLKELLKSKPTEETTRELQKKFKQMFLQSYLSNGISQERIDDFLMAAYAIIDESIPINIKVEFPSGNVGKIEDNINLYHNDAGWEIILDVIGYNDINEEYKKEIEEELRFEQELNEDEEVLPEELEERIEQEIQMNKQAFFDGLPKAKIETTKQVKGLNFRLINSEECEKEIEQIEKLIKNKYKDKETISETDIRLDIADLISKKSFSSTVLLNGNEVINIRKLKKDFKEARENIDNLSDDLYHFFINSCGDIAHYNKEGWKEEWGSVDNFIYTWTTDEMSPNWKSDAVKLQKYMYRQVNGYTKPVKKYNNFY